MTARRTAYQHRSEPIADVGEVTVDVYVLWPDGNSPQAASLLQRVTSEVLEQVQQAS